MAIVTQYALYCNNIIDNGDLNDSNPILTLVVQSIPYPSFHRLSNSSPD